MILDIKTTTNQNIKVNPQHIKSVRVKEDFVRIITNDNHFDISHDEWERIRAQI